MRLYELICEARKNPEQNPKIAINDFILAQYEYTADKIAGVPNIFVSFTSIDKLGINPSSPYNTPLGIYSYPVSYMVRGLYRGEAMNEIVPFAGDSKFANTFRATGNIVNVTSMKGNEVSEYYKKINKVYRKYSGLSFKESADQVEQFIVDAQNVAMHKTLPGGQFWYVSMMAAEGIAQFTGSAVPVAWNKLFRECGIDGVVDTGRGIIHTSEPTQAVFFSISAITDVKRFENKYSPSHMSDAKREGEVNKKVSSSMAKMSYPEIKDAIKRDAEVIRFVKAPTEELQLEAIQSARAPFIITLIRNPTEKTLLASMQKFTGSAVTFMFRAGIKLDEKMMLAAVARSSDTAYALLEHYTVPVSVLKAIKTKYGEKGEQILAKFGHGTTLKESSNQVPDLPSEPGSEPIKSGFVRLYHQTSEEALNSIKQNGLQLAHAKGIEGPRAIYAGETPFYGKATSRPTLEFQVPKTWWDSPFVLHDVTPEYFIAIHLPWHKQARYLEANPEVLQRALTGDFDNLKGDYAEAVAYVKLKHGQPPVA